MHLRITVLIMSTIVGAADILTYYCVVYKYHSITGVGAADASCYSTVSYTSTKIGAPDTIIF